VLEYIKRYDDREAFRKAGELLFHPGSIKGAYPHIVG